jgi:hypothetical protein
MPPIRKILLGLALAATVAAAVVDLPTQEALQARGASPVVLAAVQVPVPLKPPEGQGLEPVRGRFEPRAGNLFAARSWQPPPQRAKVEAPRAPALPFRYLGKVMDGKEVVAFLGQGERTYLLHAGEVLANYWVEEITQSEMTLVYLPLNEKQRLIFGSAD